MIKNLKIYILLFLIIFTSGCVQFRYQNTWRKIYDFGKSELITYIEKSKDGKYIFAGMTNSKGTGQDDFYYGKINKWGELFWQETYGGENDDTANCIRQTSDGGYIIVGESYSFGTELSKDLYVIKLNSKGELAWGKNFGGKGSDGGRWVEETEDGKYIIVGWTRSFGSGLSDFYILKLKSNGELEWEKTWGGANFEEANSIVETEDGFIIVGFTLSEGAGSKDVAILKIDSQGNVTNYKTYGGIKDDVAVSIKKLHDGNYGIIGNTSSFGNGNFDVLLLKIDSSLNILLEKTYGGESDDVASDFIEDSENNLVITGYTKSFGMLERDVYILKVNNSGELIWQKIYGGEDIDEGRSLVETSEGYIIAGQTRSFGSPTTDILLLKINGNGEF